MAKRPEVVPKLQEIAARPGVTVPWERITINRWKPDTCECVIEQWFDDAADPRVVRYANILSTGPEHTVRGETLWDTINGENRRKNGVLAAVEAVIDEVTRQDFTTWRFLDSRLPGSDERVFEVTISNVNQQQRNSVRSATDLQFGANSVEVR